MESTNKSAKLKKRPELDHLAYLRSMLGYGDIKMISKMAGVSKNVVSQYFNGESKNSGVAPYVEAFVKYKREIIESKVKAALSKKEEL